MSKRSPKPKPAPPSPPDPKVAAAAVRSRDFQAAGMAGDASKLEANVAVQVRRNGLKQTLSASRLDVFDTLRRGMVVGAFDAIRLFQKDRAIRLGEHDRGQPSERVDQDRRGDRCDDMLAARDRINATLAAIGALDGALLQGLLDAPLNKDWRETVKEFTGEDNPVAQAAAVRMACANLALAYRLRVRRRAA